MRGDCLPLTPVAQRFWNVEHTKVSLLNYKTVLCNVSRYKLGTF